MYILAEIIEDSHEVVILCQFGIGVRYIFLYSCVKRESIIYQEILKKKPFFLGGGGGGHFRTNFDHFYYPMKNFSEFYFFSWSSVHVCSAGFWSDIKRGVK